MSLDDHVFRNHQIWLERSYGLGEEAVAELQKQCRDEIERKEKREKDLKQAAKEERAMNTAAKKRAKQEAKKEATFRKSGKVRPEAPKGSAKVTFGTLRSATDNTKEVMHYPLEPPKEVVQGATKSQPPPRSKAKRKPKGSQKLVDVPDVSSPSRLKTPHVV